MESSSHEIAKGFTAAQFLALNLVDFPSADWYKAIEVLENRIELRYLSPLKNLKNLNDNGNTFGFIVLTSAFALVETLEGFRKGVSNHNGNSKQLFEASLQDIELLDGTTTRSLTNTERADIYRQGRCALLHSGGTDQILIGISGPILEKKSVQGYRINRDKFVSWIEVKFINYLSELRGNEPGENSILRENFKKKMYYICSNA